MKPIVLVICVLCAFASFGLAQEAEQAQEDVSIEYGDCPNPYSFCSGAHGTGSIPTAGCKAEDCFEMTRNDDEIRVVAADELGFYPHTWFAWYEGELISWGSPACILTLRSNKGGNKARLEIPDDKFRCGAKRTTAGHGYYEHFVSNPETGCLAWLECTDPQFPSPSF